MKKQSTIPKPKIDAVLACYADTLNFNEVSRKFGYSSYMIRKQWGSITSEKQNKYLHDAEQRKNQTLNSYVAEKQNEIITSIELTIKVRDNILTKLDNLVTKINSEDVKSIFLIKEAANTLKSISSITLESDPNNANNDLNNLLSQFTEKSTLKN